MATRISRRTFLECAALSPLVWAGCARRLPRPPSVVCIMIDQLRKDAADIFCTRINQLALQGVVIERMRAVAPWTYPSVVSMMSGLYPQQHNADGHLVHNSLSTFDAQVPLLQGILRTSGYHTAAFVVNPFLHRWNPFHVGFEHYDISFINSVGNQSGYPQAVWIPERMFANTVNEAIVHYFDRRPLEQPEFTYVHYMDVHGPWKGAPFPPDHQVAVRYVDRHVAAIYDYFMRRYQGDVIFIVTSDHGRGLLDDHLEGYGSTWRISKASVHDFNLRIPFLALPSNHVRQHQVVREDCSNIDVVPTVLDWLGIKLAHRSPGISLLPAIRGGRAGPENRVLYAKHSAFGSLQDCIVYHGRKYIRFHDAETRKVVTRRAFDLVADPHETESVTDDFTEVSALLREAAGSHGASYEAVWENLPAETIRRLRALGYL